jgi:hypothetical protein
MPEMTEMLLDIGGDPNAKVVNKFYDGMNLLMSVLQRQSMDFPMKEGVQIDHTGSSPELVQKMLDQGADVNSRTNNGTNSAYHAISAGSSKSLPLLIAKGLDPKRPVSADSFLPYDMLAPPKVWIWNPLKRWIWCASGTIWASPSNAPNGMKALMGSGPPLMTTHTDPSTLC